MSSLAKNYLKEFVDAGESNYRSAVRQASIDGNVEYPPPEASELSDRSKWEIDLLNKAKDAWEVYSGKVKVERERVFSEYTTLSEKLERDNERSQGSINKRQKTDLETSSQISEVNSSKKKRFPLTIC